jgi:hypothetical protein
MVLFAYGDVLQSGVGRFQAWALDVVDQEAARNR